MKKFVRRIAACFCIIALTAIMVPGATAAVIPAVKSDNFDYQSYSPWSRTVKSYLYDSGKGLTRVEYIPAQKAVLIETYSENRLVSLDHGDAYPRSFVLYKSNIGSH